MNTTAEGREFEAHYGDLFLLVFGYTPLSYFRLLPLPGLLQSNMNLFNECTGASVSLNGVALKIMYIVTRGLRSTWDFT